MTFSLTEVRKEQPVLYVDNLANTHHFTASKISFLRGTIMKTLLPQTRLCETAEAARVQCCF